MTSSTACRELSGPSEEGPPLVICDQRRRCPWTPASRSTRYATILWMIFAAPFALAETAAAIKARPVFL